MTSHSPKNVCTCRGVMVVSVNTGDVMFCFVFFFLFLKGKLKVIFVPITYFLQLSEASVVSFVPVRTSASLKNKN